MAGPNHEAFMKRHKEIAGKTKKEWDKIIAYSRAAYESMKTEIGGMALMIKDDNDDWHLKFPVILKQTVTAGNTHLDKEALAEYYGQTAYKMLKKKATYRYLWWHSHHTMGAFWSGTDQDTINEAEEMSDLSFSLVVNLKEEYKFRVALWKPVQVQQDVNLQIEQKEKKVSKAIKDGSARGYIDYANFNNTEYENLLGDFREYTEKYLTTESMAKYLLEEMKKCSE